MRKTVIALAGIMFIGAASAADVAQRQSCVDIKARIDALAAQTELNDGDRALLTDLRASYRRDCMARAGSRASRTIAASRKAITGTDDNSEKKAEEQQPASEEVVIAEPCDNPDTNGCCPGEEFVDMGDNSKFCCKGDMCFPPMNVTPAQPEKTEEEIAAEIEANIAKGLCGDGTRPNKFGCCTGEIFRDLGNATFACCKKDSNECFPPMN